MCARVGCVYRSRDVLTGLVSITSDGKHRHFSLSKRIEAEVSRCQIATQMGELLFLSTLCLTRKSCFLNELDVFSSLLRKQNKLNYMQ